MRLFLQLGYKGGLSSSKSVGDLSNAGDVADILAEKPRLMPKGKVIFTFYLHNCLKNLIILSELE